MPAASSSRRKAKRQNSEDIEMDGPTQDQMDDVESDGDAPRPSGKRGGKQANKSSKKKTQAQESEGEDAADEDPESDDERIDVSNFTDQPLTKANAFVIHGMASDWTNCDKMIRQHWNLMNDIGIALADAAEGDDEPEEIAQLDQIMREAIDISAKFQNNSKVLEDIYQRVARGEEIPDAMDRYFGGVKSENKEYQKKTSRQKYAKVQEYLEFKTGIWDAMYPDTPMPPLTNFIEKEEGDVSDDDDDLEIGGQTQDYKCPITLTLLVKPMTSTVCGHSYSGEAIRASFRGPHPISCPAAGCRKKITLDMLKSDNDLAKRVKAYERRMARHDEDSDAEEIID